MALVQKNSVIADKAQELLNYAKASELDYIRRVLVLRFRDIADDMASSRYLLTRTNATNLRYTQFESFSSRMTR